MSVVNDDLVAAGRVLAHAGLVTAFGHVSVRTSPTGMVITPPHPLGTLTAGSPFVELDTGSDGLPATAAKESWVHLAIADARPDVRAICRAQPETATALASAGVPIRPIHGQGSFLGDEIPVFTDPRLVRDRERAVRLADVLGHAPGLLMRGNGAITVGTSVAHAVARMWVLEASARINATATASGTASPLDLDEQRAWRESEIELCHRIWDHMRGTHLDH
ncbi:MAG: class II aldolase/adducin family protein [Janibacter sp.]